MKYTLECTGLYTPGSSSDLQLKQKWTLAFKIMTLLKTIPSSHVH